MNPSVPLTAPTQRQRPPGGLAIRALTTILLGAFIDSAAVRADDGRSHCTWGPVNDLQAVQMLLDDWAASTNLPPFDKRQWHLTIDGGRVRLMLPFAQGALTLAWQLDDNCEPSLVTIQASADYDGPRLDDSAVRQLAASFRRVAVEHRNAPRGETSHQPSPPTLAVSRALLLVPVAAMLAIVLLLARPSWRAMRTARGALVPALAQLRDWSAADFIRLLGVVAIVGWLAYQSAPTGSSIAAERLHAHPAALIGILSLITFLWLFISGYFGYGSPSRADWPALLPFLLALAIREGYARHSIQELEIYFFYGVLTHRHSVVHPLVQVFLQSLADDPYWFMMHVNGILGSLAALPLYLFVRHRTRSRMTAVLVATLFAVHPIVAQMAPTDGPYSLIFFTWFSGLALLSANDVGARQLFGAVVLLGIAATCRAEGSLYLVASLLLIDPRALLTVVRRHAGTAWLAAGALVVLVAVHVYACFPDHVPEGRLLPDLGPLAFTDVIVAGLLSLDFNDPIFVALVAVGALAGLADPRFRIGVGAAVASLIVVWPVASETTGGFTVVHRLVPVCAIQTIAAGVGAAWLTGMLPSPIRRHWAAALPALAVALYLFAAHRHHVGNPNAVTDEFSLLRSHLAPGGDVKEDCTLLALGHNMDTDIHDFSQVLPGLDWMHCEQQDCVRAVSEGGCFYYLRSLNCYLSESGTRPECRERGRTAAGNVHGCMHPRCIELETKLELSTIEERTVDLYTAFRGVPDRPVTADIGLYRVIRARH